MANPLPVVLPSLFLLLQLGVLALAPTAIARPAAYAVMVLAPLAASLTAAWRAQRSGPELRGHWAAVALGLVVWSIGAFSNLWHELVLGHAELMYRDAMFAFNLAAVPIAFVLAGEGRRSRRQWAAWIDALLAFALGVAYFLFLWSMLTARGAPDMAGVIAVVWLFDTQNLVLTLGALVRWRAATDGTERAFLRALTAYLVLYTLIVFVNNHYIGADPRFGPEHSSIISIAFALIACFALREPPATPETVAANATLNRSVRGASPFLLGSVLLMVSLALIRVDYASGVAGVLLAVFGFALISTVAQVRHIERGDQLQTIAWTDALTGVPNRHFLERSLAVAWRQHRRSGRPLAVLMIDIDHFKPYNDRYGHPAGDACLRHVAHALQSALVRPDDVLVRYGGEEFLALLHDADLPAARVVGERARAAVEAMGLAHAGSPHGFVTVSIGAASATVLPSSPDDASARLVEAADRALYAAKCDGRNRVGAS